MNKESKQQVVAELHEKLTRAKAVFLADFRGMNVGKATELRNELRKAAVEYKVVKNTLLDLASNETDKESLKPFFTGPTAVALSYEDPVNHYGVMMGYSTYKGPALPPFYYPVYGPYSSQPGAPPRFR